MAIEYLAFLERLREKLKFGNLNSIHLNALPGRYVVRLDLAELSNIKPNFAEEFLDLLLTKSNFKFEISFKGINLNSIKPEEQKKLALLSKRLNALVFENEDNYKEHGFKTFSFGYPLLIKPSKSDPKKIIKAPLFIWQLEIVKSTNKINTWTISRNDDIHGIVLNEVFRSYIKNDENIDIEQMKEELLDDAVIDKKELLEECQKILEKLNTKSNIKDLEVSFNEPLINIPENRKLESIVNQNGYIHFGGIFGLFRVQKESIITDIDKIIEKYNEFDFEDSKMESFSGIPYSAIETDPSQQEILSTLGTETKKIIQGPPGTGKSQSLTAILVNALANNKKCLVVCEKKTALDVIKKNLTKENPQLGELAAVIEDINKGREIIVDSVRNRTIQSLPFNKMQYENILLKIDKTVKDINNQHKLLDEIIYQGKTWSNLIGEYLNLQRKYGAQNFEFNRKQFNFGEDENELNNFIDKIKNAEKLYAKINTLEHPLEILNSNMFMLEQSKLLQLTLEEFCGNMSNKVLELKTKIQNQIDNYKKWLDNHYDNYYTELNTKINDYISFNDEKNNEYGDIFYKNEIISKIFINLFSLFSKKYKKMKNDRIHLIEYISEIKKSHLSNDYIEHIYVEEQKPKTLRIYLDNITNLKHSTETWHEKNPSLKENFVEKMSTEILHNKYEQNKKNIIEVEERYEDIISALKKESIFEKTYKNVKNHKEKERTLENIHYDLNLILQNLDTFIEYFNWKSFYLTLSPLEQDVIKILIKSNHKSPENIFKVWYNKWLISTVEKEQLPKEDDNIKELINLKQNLKNDQIKGIINNWLAKQQYSKLKSNININSLFNKRGTKGTKRNSLRKIVLENFELFTDYFPIVMLSPTICSSILPLKEKLFDIVIFDEASQLRLEDSFAALIRGKVKIISGDSQQMPPSNFFQGGSALIDPTDDDYEQDDSIIKLSQLRDLADSESLLNFAEQSNYKPSNLKVHYRSKHPDLIQFSNHAFYNNKLIPMPAEREYTPIEFIQVNGLYDEHINENEAKQVIDILLNIKPLENGKYPSVGIATFNIYQRNLINEKITEIELDNSEYATKIAKLKAVEEQNEPLFVKNLENIQGDERDIIIISTTFGKNKKGSFIQNFGPITQQNGYKLLNVIVTRAKHKIFVCTSIPQEIYSTYVDLIKQKGNNGSAIFYAYLAYAKAVSENNKELKESLLELLCQNKYESKNTYIAIGSESPFEEEVFCRLAEVIGEKRLEQQYKVGGFRIDMVVKPEQKDKPIIAIECDGAKYHSSNEAYAWDMFRQSQLERFGFIFYRIWSTNWWHNPEKELEKLVNFIRKYS